MNLFRMQGNSFHRNDHKALKAVLITKCSLFGFALSKLLSEYDDVLITDVLYGNEYISNVFNKPTRWDLIIIDEDDVSGSEIKIVARLAEARLSVPVIILTSSFSDKKAIDYMRSGACAYLSKSTKTYNFSEKIISAVRKRNIFRENKVHPLVSLSLSKGNLHTMSIFETLTPCEKSVIEYLFKGMSVTEISQFMKKSIKTISTQKQAALKKLGIKNTSNIFCTMHSDRNH